MLVMAVVMAVTVVMVIILLEAVVELEDILGLVVVAIKQLLD